MTIAVDQDLSERAATVLERISQAARRAGREPEDIMLVAVSKTWGPETVVAAYHAGLRIFGENRVEEARPKAEAVAHLLSREPTGGPVTWHMIGHLQSRKARDVFPWAGMVHSVDSTRLARRLSELSIEAGRVLPILLEVNVSGEASKNGLQPAAVPGIVEELVRLPGLRPEGLMTMAPMLDDAEDARPVFRSLRDLRDRLSRDYAAIDWRHLSMGMTGDFEVAIEEGATIVRIGRAIFGERPCALG